ncbi:4F5 protein family protein [Hordeum vulgare]|nr:4F5 protein family protein [Hordeum vulgare]
MCRPDKEAQHHCKAAPHVAFRASAKPNQHRHERNGCTVLNRHHLMTMLNPRDRDRERAAARKPNSKNGGDGLTPEQRRERFVPPPIPSFFPDRIQIQSAAPRLAGRSAESNLGMASRGAGSCVVFRDKKALEEKNAKKAAQASGSTSTDAKTKDGKK